MDPLHPAHGKPPRAGAREAYLDIERFLKASKQPVLMEPGEDPLPIAADAFALKCHGETVVLESWNETRNLVRRIRGIRLERRGRLEVDVERFGRLTGTLALVDLDNPSNRDADRRGARLKYRELFRRSLRRQFPDWRLAEISTEQDLHHSLSPSYPRALLRKGKSGMAAIGAAEDSPDPDGAQLRAHLARLPPPARARRNRRTRDLCSRRRGAHYLPSHPLPQPPRRSLRRVRPRSPRPRRRRRSRRLHKSRHASRTLPPASGRERATAYRVGRAAVTEWRR